MVWTITDVEKIKDCQARANSATAVCINPFSVAGFKKTNMIYTIGSVQLFKAFACLVLNLIVFPSGVQAPAVKWQSEERWVQQAVETCESEMSTTAEWKHGTRDPRVGFFLTKEAEPCGQKSKYRLSVNHKLAYSSFYPCVTLKHPKLCRKGFFFH